MMAAPIAVVVTGASRGFGQAVCLAICKALAPHKTKLIVIARSQTGLSDTIKSALSLNPNLTSHAIVSDLSTHSGVANCCTQLQQSLSEFSRLIVVHNAGSLGPQFATQTLSDQTTIETQFSFNVASVISLNSVLLQVALKTCPNPAASHVFVNVSSLAAIQPFPHWTSYCTNKAARDMLFRVLAIEQKPEFVRVLNYAPGPMLTEITTEIMSNPDTPITTLDAFRSMQAQDKFVQTSDSARRLTGLILVPDNKYHPYQSGDHVDVFDLPPDSLLDDQFAQLEIM